MKNTKIYAYYFPNWHVDKRNDVWHGKGWTEWEVTKCARPRFEGHHQPLKPVWGYEDESDSKVMEKKIAVAKEYGIDGFIFDTYYYDDGPYREKCLDEGFLKAKNNREMEFAVMWCNHDAIYAHPSPRLIVSPVLKSGAVTEEAFVNITNDFIKKYFCQPNYMKIDGKIFFIIYNVGKLIKEFGAKRKPNVFLKNSVKEYATRGLAKCTWVAFPTLLKIFWSNPKNSTDCSKIWA